MTDRPAIDPTRDLVLERIVGVRPELIWRAWTEPDLLKRWFTPAPWETIDCDIDLRRAACSARRCAHPTAR